MTGLGIETVPQMLSPKLQIWRVNLDVHSRAAVHPGLAADELARAESFVHSNDRRRFMAARHALRSVLGSITARDPAQLVFTTGAFGKPALVDAGGLDFNLSHSADECLIAVGHGLSVGADVEVIEPIADADALTRLHFTDRERSEWTQAAPEAREHAFLVCWTRKEAVLKALGAGLSIQPSRLHVGCTKQPQTAVITFNGRRTEIACVSLTPAVGSIGAVAVSRYA